VTGNPRIYLDHNATAPLRPAARAAMLEAMDVFGNASSVHAEGRRARAIVEETREVVADLVGARASEVVFVSGATEANNWVVGAGWETILAADVEHDSVRAPIAASGAHHVVIPVGENGEADLGRIADHVLVGSRTLGRDLVALQLANSETGVIQDVAAAAEFCAAHDVWIHTDATQCPGRIPVDFRALGVDTLAISAHKLGGPKGVGALIIRAGRDIGALMRGGGQETRRRAGTENVAAIAGFGAAAREAKADLATMERLRAMRDGLEQRMIAAVPEAVVFGANAPRLANTSCVGVPGTKAETLLIKLDLKGIAVSAGSACSVGKVETSAVLTAMGVWQVLGRSALRISLGWTSSENDLEPFLTTWGDAVAASRAKSAA